uniref:N-acetyltransferase domain-containing protein n=1 Tax=Angiostrongylus cantonensis TaxID=6313 RepID=A0A0K0DQ74_ANGCA
MDRYDELRDRKKIDDAQLAADLDKGAVDGFVLREDDEPAAMVLFYLAYSTWEGRYIHMEDLYVRPAFRRKGYGKILWQRLGQLAKEMRVSRLQWNVLDWNSSAIAFYKKLSCEDLTRKEGWLLYRLDVNGINELAGLKPN